MDFSLTDDQQLLKASVERFLEREYDFATRQKILDKNGFDLGIWEQLANTGLLGANCSEAAGGFGGGIETMLIMELFGRYLVLEPLVQCAVIAGTILANGERTEIREKNMPSLIRGEIRACVATMELGMRSPYETAQIRCKATRRGTAWDLCGAKTFVYDGAAANYFLVTARGADDEISIFMVSRDTAGLRVRTARTQDGHTIAELTLDSVAVSDADRIESGTAAVNLLEYALDRGMAASCAEAVGSMDFLLEATIAYTRERRQYGAPLASFQALQHRMAEMFVELETARSMACLAACAVDAAADRIADISAARVQVGRAARFVGRQAVQLHGGMGMAEENPVAHHFKKLTMITQLFGDEGMHLRRFRAAGRDREPRAAR
jgi:alkylation response protein AidB-like acyl-CoA dehydrogenase